MKRLVIGILAHVDSGKTTLSEALLYRAGALRKLMIQNCTEADMTELFRIAGVYQVKIAGYSPSSVLLESVRTEEENDELAHLLEHRFTNRMEIVRGGSVAVESVRT